jgi:RNA polymerase sigma-70 factor (ECF subfamily)
LRALEHEYLEPVLSVSAATPARDDLRQTVLEKLLLHREGGRRRLEEYSGRSSLRTWIKVVAKRVQLNLARGHASRPTDNVDELSESNLIPAGSDPELDYLRCRYAYEFQLAFRAALRSLDARSTLLLKMHLVERASGSEMAALFGVSRVTVVRWMVGVRQQLLSVTREHLLRERKLSRTEFESVVRLVWKHLNVSLSLLEREPS